MAKWAILTVVASEHDSAVKREPPCMECGYRHDTERREISSSIRDISMHYADLLKADANHLRAHVGEGVWSPLEYTCHMRDVLRVQRQRLQQTLTEALPRYASMNRDERAVDERYNEQEPNVVAGEILTAAGDLASALQELDDDGWARRGVYNHPVEQVVDIEWIGRRTIHELVHHLMDIERQLPSKPVRG